jgi:ATP-dependent Clp protease ATP-binding subunit ClpX
MPAQNPVCCDFCFNTDIALYEGGSDPPVHICGLCAAQAVAQTTPQPSPEPATPPVPPSKEARLALVPSPKSVVAHLDQFVIGQEVAKRRIAVGVSNHFKRVVDAWVADDAIVTDPDLLHVRIEKSNILLIGPSGSGKTYLVKSLASYLNVPLVVGDATSLSETG